MFKCKCFQQAMKVADSDDVMLDAAVEPMHTTLNMEQVLLFFTGATQPPITGFSKHIEIEFSADVDYPRISTCFLEAKFPINFKGSSKKEYLLHARGRRGREKACACFTSWVFEGPGYGHI